MLTRFFGILISLLLLLSALPGMAQYVQEDTAKSHAAKPAEPKQPNPFWSKLRFGGNFGGAFGKYSSYAELSPMVTYMVTDKVMVGPGITYIYQRYQNPYGGYQSSHIYGGRVLSRYLITETLFAHVELEGLNLPYYKATDSTSTSYVLKRGWIISPLVGGGARLPLGARSAVFVTALYNLAYDSNKSPYSSPFVFRIGATF